MAHSMVTHGRGIDMVGSVRLPSTLQQESPRDGIHASGTEEHDAKGQTAMALRGPSTKRQA